jgi:hypothetical protein
VITTAKVNKLKQLLPNWRVFLVFAFTDQVAYIPLLPTNPWDSNISQLSGKDHFNIPTTSLHPLCSSEVVKSATTTRKSEWSTAWGGDQSRFTHTIQILLLRDRG